MPALFTIGYDPRIGEFAERLRAQIVDVRARPSGQVKAGWKAADLARTFGTGYEWHGKTLGGRAFLAGSEDWIEAPLEILEPIAERSKKENLILLCACFRPWECHRHNEIAAPLLASTSVDALHIYGDQLIETSELNRSLTDGKPYDYHDLLDWMNEHAEHV